MESLLVLEDQPSANRVSYARGFTLGELETSGSQYLKAYRAFYKLGSFVIVA